MKRILFLGFLLMGAASSYGQLDNRAFEDRMKVDPADSNKLFLGMNVLGFSKDNEYNDAIVQGYTLFGYQLNPHLSYHLSGNLRMDAGIFLQKDFGNTNYTSVVPTFSIKYQKNHFGLIFGNLEGSLNHRLIEPLYDFERVLNNRLENGLQAQIIRDNLFMDVWIDWRKMIYLNDDKQEELTAGFNITPRILKRGNTELSLPIQLVTHHKGGEINFSFSGPIETLVNTAVGVELKNTHETGLIRETRLSGYLAYYKSITNELQQPYGKGSGTYFNAGVKTKFGLEVMGTYWQGDKFVTIEGGKIYPSVSVFDQTKVQAPMQLIMLRVLYSIPIQDGLYAGARAEPFYDLSFNSFNYSIGVYLNFRERFFLIKKK